MKMEYREIDDFDKGWKKKYKSRFNEIVYLKPISQKDWIIKFLRFGLSNKSTVKACLALDIKVSVWKVSQVRREIGMSGTRKKRGEHYRNNVLISN